MPSETPSLLLLTGPKIISSKRNVDITLIVTLPKLTLIKEAETQDHGFLYQSCD